jgi:hypothetical protein
LCIASIGVLKRGHLDTDLHIYFTVIALIQYKILRMEFTTNQNGLYILKGSIYTFWGMSESSEIPT